MRTPQRLFETVQRFVQPTNQVHLAFLSKTFQLKHINLFFKFSMKKCSFYILTALNVSQIQHTSPRLLCQTIKENISLNSIPSFLAYLFTNNLARYRSTWSLPSRLILQTHLFPMSFLPCGSGTSSHVLFLCRASISSYIAIIHKETSELFKVSWKVDGSPSSIRRQYATLIFLT